MARVNEATTSTPERARWSGSGMAAPSLMASSGTTETRPYRTDDWSSEQIGAFSAAVGFDRIGRRFAALDVDEGVQIWSVPTNKNSPLEIQVIPLERLHLKAFGSTPVRRERVDE